MTEALIEGGRKLGKVLEVGTGCGYQTAVLAPLVKKIYSIERIAPLAKRAKATLKELGIKNVMLKHGDGTVGWKSQKPFDGILVAAAPLAVPEALFAQLANRGRLIVPVGPEGRAAADALHAQRAIDWSAKCSGRWPSFPCWAARPEHAAPRNSSKFSNAIGFLSLLFYQTATATLFAPMLSAH